MNSSGRGPDNRLFSRIIVFKLGISPILAGIVPVNLFPCNTIVVKE
jgi:hypothetical protein